MKKRVWKTSAWLLGGFVLFFLFRLGYSISEKDYYDEEDGIFDGLEYISESRKNYASSSYKYKAEAVQGAAYKEISVDQKYEKVAEVASRSEKFEESEKKVRGQLQTFNTVIQFEQKTGSKGSRKLLLMIGVKPERFDSLYESLRRIGNIKKAEITKVDKTNEFRALNARKASLEKTRDALLALKKQSGKIDEYINLEDRILAIEDTLQFLGVSLGDFDSENEFCTIRYALNEARAKVKMSFLHRIKVSLEWALEYYLYLLSMLVVIFICSFVLVLLIDKLRLLQLVFKKYNGDS